MSLASNETSDLPIWLHRMGNSLQSGDLDWGYGGLVIKRNEVFVTGRVQGVGFRYTAVLAARSYDIVGTVQNLSDGRVKLVVEGAQETIDQFIDRVCESTQGSIKGLEKLNFPATGEFEGFEIIR